MSSRSTIDRVFDQVDALIKRSLVRSLSSDALDVAFFMEEMSDVLGPREFRKVLAGDHGPFRGVPGEVMDLPLSRIDSRTLPALDSMVPSSHSELHQVIAALRELKSPSGAGGSIAA